MFQKNSGVYSIKKQSWQSVQRTLIFIFDTDHDYILDEILHRDHVKYESQNHNENE